MKAKDAILFGAKVADEIEELHDLKPGQQKVVPALLKVRVDGVRWKVGVVLEKDEET